MKRSQNGFAHPLALVLIFVVIAVVIFTGWRVFHAKGAKSSVAKTITSAIKTKPADNSPPASVINGMRTDKLAACPSGTNLFNHTIIDEANIKSIDPMGIMTGQHIIPAQADHFYIYSIPNKPSPVYAPADVTLLAVTKGIIVNGSDSGVGGPKTIFIAPCRSVVLSLQLSSFSPAITNLLANTKPTSDQKSTIVENIAYTNLSLKIKSGEQLGTIGDPGFSNSLDFATEDTRTQPLGYINKTFSTGSMGDSYFHTVCGLDYFSGSIKQSLSAHLTSKNSGANGVPACGTTMQDKAGTAQGDWFHQGGAQYDTSSYLALAHYHEDPTQAVFSVGTNLIPSGNNGTQILYTPQHSGYVNREPSEITSDGHVYCIGGNTGNGTGHVNFQLTDNATMKVEYTSGTCPPKPTIGSAALSYNR